MKSATRNYWLRIGKWHELYIVLFCNRWTKMTETLYDEDRNLMAWNSAAEIEKYIKENYPTLTIIGQDIST